jgi:hypothetical protein
MTVTPPPSTPGAWPLDDEVFAIEQQIADLQRAADQAQASGAVAASEVAIAQKAIRELSTAKAEIQEKGKLWDRTSQLTRALEERRRVAERVRQAIASSGNLAESLKLALENRLKPKFKIDAATPLDDLNTAVEAAEEALGDADIKTAFFDAESAFKTAEVDYQAKAAAAEEAWLTIQNGARILEEGLQRAQAAYAEAVRLEASAETPAPAAGGTPAGPVLASAAEAGIAWKSFNDTFELLKGGTRPSTTTGQPDDGETALIIAWTTASDQAKDALAVLLTRRQELAVARNAHEQRQALRPARKPSEQAAMVARVLTAFNPPPPPGS